MLVINRRNLQALGYRKVFYSEFAELCLAPRSAADYTQLAKEYHSVLIDNVPELTLTSRMVRVGLLRSSTSSMIEISKSLSWQIVRWQAFIRARSSALSFNARCLD